jgi:hypothetical protein
VAFMVSWFLTYPLLIRLAYAQPGGERLAVMTSGTWLLRRASARWRRARWRRGLALIR